MIVSSVEQISDETLEKIGFSVSILDGADVVPQECGRYTYFNLYGKNIVRKDLPKENRYVNTVYWEWTLWNGDKQGDYFDVCRDCYPKDFILPPLEKVYFNKEKKSVFSREIEISQKQELMHVVNVFLEIFGSCVVTDDENNIIPVKRVPWVIFPIGERPFNLENLFPNHNKVNKRERRFLNDRISELKKYNPTAVYQGESYFRNYLAFEYRCKNIVVLESDCLDNATYIFSQDWKTCSQFTKGEVLQNHLHKERVIHQKNWFLKISKILG